MNVPRMAAAIDGLRCEIEGRESLPLQGTIHTLVNLIENIIPHYIKIL
jgi:hypothetical protein